MKFCSKILFVVMLLSSCGRPSLIEEYSEYVSYLNDEKNGVSQTKKVGGFILTLKYLPQDYLVYGEVKSVHVSDQKLLDSLRKQYSNSMTFMMSIEPDEEKGNKGDITFSGTRNYNEYKERFLEMSFGLENDIRLATASSEYSPVLVNTEQSYGLRKGRDVIIVFIPSKDKKELEDSPTYDFIYEDELFDLGINHFVFNKEDIEAIPTLNFRI